MSKLVRMTDEDLRGFVLGLCDGSIFVSTEVPRVEDIPLLFLPLAFGVLAGWTREELGEIGVFWEYREKALPRAINGMPVFMSCRMMHRDDWDRARAAAKAELERRQTIAV